MVNLYFPSFVFVVSLATCPSTDFPITASFLYREKGVNVVMQVQTSISSAKSYRRLFCCKASNKLLRISFDLRVRKAMKPFQSNQIIHTDSMYSIFSLNKRCWSPKQFHKDYHRCSYIVNTFERTINVSIQVRLNPTPAQVRLSRKTLMAGFVLKVDILVSFSFGFVPPSTRRNRTLFALSISER